MKTPKTLYAAIIVALILTSTGIFIGQIANFFGKTANGKITGTIVLKDLGNTQAGISDMPSTVSLPGTTCSKVIITSCGFGPVITAAPFLFSFDQTGLTKIKTNFAAMNIISSSNYSFCQATAYSNINSAPYVILPWSCNDGTAFSSGTVGLSPTFNSDCGGLSQIRSLVVSYSCT
ncbi:MAG: hypothetical protein HYW50_00200 [Candidatus Diapherotrites archaeon]|nr:hypothetical protein [Candidatus Diapherotrites archaeon]